MSESEREGELAILEALKRRAEQAEERHNPAISVDILPICVPSLSLSMPSSIPIILHPVDLDEL